MANKLANETSPYLLQHAENPVDWQPWGPEALAEAQRRDLPLLVSIGYSACHWCHVMEHESFSDPEVAQLMNENFICIKVDREERPDVDALFMDACQAMTGSGGWPLNAFATPDGKPFWAGTYFPPTERGGQPAWRSVLLALADSWQNERRDIEAATDRVVERLSSSVRLAAADQVPGEELLARAVEGIGSVYDRQHGGFGAAPKFPATEAIEFLLQRGENEMSLGALQAMARGGIHDQIGGGFARYAVDSAWVVPHFEKMLYDNALLARAYLHGWQVSGDEYLRSVCVSTLDWLLREMISPDGAFYASIDADDSEGEGRFYAWSPELVAQALPDPQDAASACRAFGITDSGNWEDGLSVPVFAHDDPDLARLRSALFETRASRPRPATDTKVLTGWNAMAVSALVDAGVVLAEPKYLEAGVRCAEYLVESLCDAEGRVMRCLRNDSAVLGVLEDSALLCAALLDVYEATGDPRWLGESVRLADSTWDRFGDPEGGGFFSTPTDGEQLAVRRKDIEDRPVPSGNATMALFLLRLHALTGEGRHLDRAEGVMRILGPLAERLPVALGRMLLTLQVREQGIKEVAIVGPAFESFARQARLALRRNVALSYSPTPSDTVPLLSGRVPNEGETLAWVCSGFTCHAPVSTPEELLSALEEPATSD